MGIQASEIREEGVRSRSTWVLRSRGIVDASSAHQPPGWGWAGWVEFQSFSCTLQLYCTVLHCTALKEQYSKQQQHQQQQRRRRPQ